MVGRDCILRSTAFSRLGHDVVMYEAKSCGPHIGERGLVLGCEGVVAELGVGGRMGGKVLDVEIVVEATGGLEDCGRT